MDNDFEKLIKGIGCVVVTFIILSIPILNALSVVFKWPGFIKFIFCILTGLEALIIYSALIDNVD